MLTLRSKTGTSRLVKERAFYSLDLTNSLDLPNSLDEIMMQFCSPDSPYSLHKWIYVIHWSDQMNERTKFSFTTTRPTLSSDKRVSRTTRKYELDLNVTISTRRPTEQLKVP